LVANEQANVQSMIAAAGKQLAALESSMLDDKKEVQKELAEHRDSLLKISTNKMELKSVIIRTRNPLRRSVICEKS
jgi:hypothetical protein